MKKIKRGIGLFLAALTMVSCNPNDGTSGLNTNNDTAFAQNFGNTTNRDFIGQIVDKDNNPIQGATVTIGSTTAQTDVNGVFIINHALVHEKFAYVTATKIGYLDGSRSLIPTAGRNNVKIMLLSNAPTATVPSDVDSEVALDNGTKVSFDGAFQDESGAAYTGTVSVTLFHLLPSNANLDALMPGMLYAQTATNQQAVLQTFGMINVELRGDAGQKLNLAEGHTAEITMKIDDTQLATAPTSIPLWHFDAAKGYWKEDGVATKIGNNYVGEVSHFSWWNCDVPFPSVTLSLKVVDANNNPIPNVTVGLQYNGNYSAMDYTDNNGQVSGLIPKDVTLTLNIYAPFYTCNSDNVIYTSIIGPFTESTILPNITIDNTSMMLSTMVSGTLLDCNGNNVTNGYVMLSNGLHYTISSVNNGSFNFAELYCPNNNGFTLYGVDFDENQSTNALSFVFTPTTTNLQGIATCNAVNQYMRYQIDGGAVLNVIGDLGFLDFTAEKQVRAYPINGFESTSSYLFWGINQPGTFNNPAQSLMIENVHYPLSNSVLTIVNMGGNGQYFDATLTANYNDSQNITHTMHVDFHILH